MLSAALPQSPKNNATTTYTYDFLHRRLTADSARYLYDDKNEIGSDKELRILGLGAGAESAPASCFKSTVIPTLPFTIYMATCPLFSTSLTHPTKPTPSMPFLTWAPIPGWQSPTHPGATHPSGTILPALSTLAAATTIPPAAASSRPTPQASPTAPTSTIRPRQPPHPPRPLR